VGLTDGNRISSSFYDRWTELFLDGFGPIFQAGTVRTGDPPREDPQRSVLALAERAGLYDGDRVLDAGCGVAGPATIIAGHLPRVVIDGVTNSARQAAIAHRRVAEKGLSSRVRVHVADYHALPFRSGQFDQVLFFETTGYSTDLEAAYREAYRVLKRAGRLYVKDVFCRSEPVDSSEMASMERFDRLWGCARSKTIAESVHAMALAGFEVSLASTMTDVGTARLAGSMVSLADDRLVLTDLGRSFLSQDLKAPIEFGEIMAVKPG
jgi:ubiquinone/menaquinone biosynthesis C-methylase UbiE